MLGLLAFTSCVDDEGNNNMSDVNEAKIEGIEDSYYKVADVENLEIPVKVTGRSRATTRAASTICGIYVPRT
mgnify:CR=1 FL=1